MEGNEWICDYHKRLGTELSEYAVEKLGREIHLAYGYGFMGKAVQSYDIMWKHGALGPAGKLFNGGMGGRGQADLDEVARWHHEHECYVVVSILDHTMEFGPIPALDEEIKEFIGKHKHMPKFVIGLKATYWTPQAHCDAAIAAAKKYGRNE